MFQCIFFTNSFDFTRRPEWRGQNVQRGYFHVGSGSVVIFQSSSGFYGRDARQTTGQLIRLFLRKVYYIPWDSSSPECVAFFLFHFGITQRGWHLENLVTSTVVIDWFKMLSAAIARPNCLQPETHSCSRSLPKRYVFHIIIISFVRHYISAMLLWDKFSQGGTVSKKMCLTYIVIDSQLLLWQLWLRNYLTL